MTRILGLVVAGVCLTLGFGQPAAADSLPVGAIALAPSASLTTDGLIVSATVTGCTDGETGSGRSATPVACPTLYMVAGSGISPSVIIEAAIGSTLTPILGCSSSSIACTVGDFDASLDVTATPVSSKTALMGAAVTLTGTETSAALNRIGGTETVDQVSNSISHQVCLLSATAAGGDDCAFPGIQGASLSMTKDFRLNGTALGPTSELSLNTITESFEVPEPASTAALLGGIIALATVRRKRRRA
jgi:hypothetical protein